MVELIPVEDKIISLQNLPPALQQKIKRYAMVDILKDQAKENIKAKQINLSKFIQQWIQLKRSKRTQRNYKKAINSFLDYLDTIDIEHPLLVKAEHVDSYLLYLKNKYKNNTIRLEMCACSSFYSSLRRYGYITTNPFYGSPLPRKEFKKAIQTDQKKTIPVMNQEEFDIIMKTLRQMSRMKGKKAQIKNSRRSARRLIPVIHFLGTYGLRVGSLLSVEVKDGYFTFTGKGNKSQRVELEDDIVKGTKPFKNYKVITIQKAISRVTGEII